MSPNSWKILGYVVLGIVVIGGYFSPGGSSTIVQSFGSATGTTFGTAKIANVNVAPLTGAATSTSILNSDASDRIVNRINIACGAVDTPGTFLTGAGLASFTLKLATTSVSSQGLQGNANLIGAAMVIATSTNAVLISTTTPAIAGNVAAFDRWASGSYLTFLFNATSTASCTVGVDYMAT